MAENRAVWQDKPGMPGVIRSNPLPKLDDARVLVKVQAWAMNPADVMVQDTDLGFIKYPLILGQDVAGVVTDVGSTAASKFEVGDRVFGFSVNNGFQDYIAIDYRLAAKIPEKLSFAEVSVFPLCISTCAFALFDPKFLGLPHPSLSPIKQNQSVLIWGGSSGIGCNAIQLAKAAGFEVITTCSPRSFSLVKNLGADKAFDYNSSSIIDDLVAEVDKGVCAGIYMAAGKVSEPCKVAHKSKQDLFVASSNPILPGDAPEGVRAKFTFGTGGIEDFESTLPITFGGYLPEALAKGVYQVAPPPHVVSTKGLEGIQEALDTLRQGVSGSKIVVEIA